MVLLDPEVLVLLDVVLMGPVVEVEAAAGWYFSSESKHAPTSHRLAPSAAVPASRRGVRAEEARGRQAEAETKDIGAKVPAIGARDEPDRGASAIPTNPTSTPRSCP